jgi:hypothetical protein
MKHLDNFENVKKHIKHTDLSTVLFSYELNEWLNLTDEAKDQKIKRICSLPLCDEDFSVAYTLYFRLKWLSALSACVHKENPTVLEIGSGSSVNIPNALTVLDKASMYVTANMNKKLTEGLRRNTASLPIEINVIEDDAINIKNHLEDNSVDAIVFEHSVNDILQAILCENKGIDTINNDWFDILPEMIKIINTEYINQTLERKVKSIFLSLINNCLSVLKPDGFIIMSHYMFQYDLDLGYNPELHENILPVIRPWLKELSAGNEIVMDTFDPQWWLFYKKQ